MSRQNKVNPGQYTQAGRLTPDDLGRERPRKPDQSGLTVHAPRDSASTTTAKSVTVTPHTREATASPPARRRR